MSRLQVFAIGLCLLCLLATAGRVAAQDPAGEDGRVQEILEALQQVGEPAARAEAAKRLHEIAHHEQAQRALPLLRRLVINDPDAAVRAAAVQALAKVAFNSRPRLCPVEVFKAWSDENEEVRGWAMAYANLFALIDPDDPQKRSVAHLEPGCEALLLVQMESKNPSARESALYFLALAPKPGDAAREAVLAARHDEHFNVRNSAHIVWFRMTDKLADIFPYYVRAMEELAPPELSDEELKKLSEQENAERCQKNLILLGISMRFVELASQRQEEAAAAMKALLRDESADTRRQTAVFLGKFGWMVGEKLPTLATPFSPFSGDGETGSEKWMQHVLPYIEQDDSQSLFRTPSADRATENIKSYVAPADSKGEQWPAPDFDYNKIREGTSNSIVFGEGTFGDWPHAFGGDGASLVRPDLPSSVARPRTGGNFVCYFTSVFRMLCGMPLERDSAGDAKVVANGSPPAKEQPSSANESQPAASTPENPNAEPGESPAKESRKPTLDWLTKHGLLDELRKLQKSDEAKEVRQAASEALRRIEERRMTPIDTDVKPLP